jgi:hypothetical protein
MAPPPPSALHLTQRGQGQARTLAADPTRGSHAPAQREGAPW